MGGEAVQQRAGEAFRSEDRSPLVEGQVDGDQDGAPLVALAPAAMTFSRRWMHPHRASSITRALFTDGMAGKSEVSRLFTAGKRAAADLIMRPNGLFEHGNR